MIETLLTLYQAAGWDVPPVPESRSSLTDAGRGTWLYEALAGDASYSGRSVTPYTAQNLSAVYGCMRVLGEDIAALPFGVYRSLPNGGNEPAKEHYAYSLLHDAPNDEMTSFTWRETMLAHLSGWGNSYNFLDWNKAGRLNGIYPLKPQHISVERVNGKLLYKYTPNSETIPIPPDYILHIPLLSYDGLIGYSPITLGRQSIGLGLAQEEFNARFYGNNAKPSIALKHPTTLSPEAAQKLLAGWRAAYGGLSNANGVAVLENGLDIKEFSIKPVDAQFLESREFGVEEICRWFRMPPHKIQHLKRATFSNIEHSEIAYGTDTLMPYCVRIEQAINQKILGGDYYCKMKLASRARGDLKSRNEAYAIAVRSGWKSPNDIAALEDENPIPGGDVYMVQGQMIRLDQVGKAVSQQSAANADPEPAGDGQ
jgi:HK97 family phage portal protein